MWSMINTTKKSELLHFRLDLPLFNRIKKEADNKKISISELIRGKLGEWNEEDSTGMERTGLDGKGMERKGLFYKESDLE
jgi:hypothetical protein